MDRYRGSIYLMCLRMTGDIHLSRELVHDSSVEAYFKIDQLHYHSKLGSWLKRIALNLSRMWLRKNKRIFVEIPEEHPEVPGDEAEAEDIYLQMAMGLANVSPPHRLIQFIRSG